MFGAPSCKRADEIAAEVKPEQWHRLSAGTGAKGERLYDWALQELFRLQLTEEEQVWGHYLLIRRSITAPEEVAYYVVHAPRKTELAELVRVAGMRWQIESCFEAAKQECGLDEYEVRKWDGWHRHVTLSLLAHAFLSVVRVTEHKKGDQSARA